MAVAGGHRVTHCQITGAASAEEDESASCPNKDQYSLFNPTPVRCMGEFNSDRPDLTDNPFTVDVGHVQFEADLVNYALSRPDEKGTVTEKFLFGSMDIRVGITNNVEIDALVQPINVLHTPPVPGHLGRRPGHAGDRHQGKSLRK